MKQIDSLHAHFQLSRLGGNVRVIGTVESGIIQTCVVTLEPFTVEIEEKVDLRFSPQADVDALEAAAARCTGDHFVDVADASNLPDPIVEGRIDLAALAVEALALGLNPYPRKPGATFAGVWAGEEVDPAPVSPFTVLRNIKPPT